jgi:hypothetical protein
MPHRARSKHRAVSATHAKAGLAALATTISVIVVVILAAGTVFAPSGAAGGRWPHWHNTWLPTWHPTWHPTATKTATATATATVTAPGPTATVTAPGPTATVTAPRPTGTTKPPKPTATGTPTSPTTTPTGSNQMPYVGAAVSGNSSPASMEASAGRVLGLHRTYWNYGNVAASIKSATADATAGRIPWLSYKLSVSWADAAAGKADAATQALAAQLATVPGPVWVAIHHEPEGDGNLSDWVALQKRLLPILAQAPNVRTSVIFTAWDTFDSGNPAYSLNALWPGNMVDIMGVDAYNRYGDATHANKGWQEMSHFYDEIAPAAKARGVNWAIAETGYTDAAAAKDPDWLTRAFDDMANQKTLPGLGLCYFNSSANSVGSWPLNAVKDKKFDAILDRSHPAL